MANCKECKRFVFTTKSHKLLQDVTKFLGECSAKLHRKERAQTSVLVNMRISGLALPSHPKPHSRLHPQLWSGCYSTGAGQLHTRRGKHQAEIWCCGASKWQWQKPIGPVQPQQLGTELFEKKKQVIEWEHSFDNATITSTTQKLWLSLSCPSSAIFPKPATCNCKIIKIPGALNFVGQKIHRLVYFKRPAAVRAAPRRPGSCHRPWRRSASPRPPGAAVAPGGTRHCWRRWDGPGPFQPTENSAVPNRKDPQRCRGHWKHSKCDVFASCSVFFTCRVSKFQALRTTNHVKKTQINTMKIAFVSPFRQAVC